ncbi:murein hydrolase activator EnvC family protein [Chelatococcus asaccharovorans]|uniref:murein hydrolase activator EnvC family protein n=1 Tax=Chelatococcus asaccharovorans TaxID=28210 RepID=UPI00226546F3|nr:M23 family metallopeptidase [Chelatococcus asaccharovorans]
MRITASMVIASVMLLSDLSMSLGSACHFLQMASDRRPVMPRPAGHLLRGFGVFYDPILKVPRQHNGWDLSLSPNRVVKAVAPGIVAELQTAGPSAGVVTIDHGGGWSTVYAHLDGINVRVGQCLESGQNLGSLGAPRVTNPPSLHIEIRHDGKAIDPRYFSVTGNCPATKVDQLSQTTRDRAQWLKI